MQRQSVVQIGSAERTNYNGARRRMFIVIGGNLVLVRLGSQFRGREDDISRNRIQGEVVFGNNCHVGGRGISNSGTAIENKLMASEAVVGWTDDLGTLSQLISLRQNESAYVNK